jgi:hypothetical protein
MRQFLTTLILIILTAGIGIAQPPSKSLQNAEKNYLTGLRHSNRGVVESAIIQTMKLKQFHPQKDFTELIKALDSLSIKSSKKPIRIKTFFASNYLKQSQQDNLFTKNDFKDLADIMDAFTK